MIINIAVMTDVEINGLTDLPKLKTFMENSKVKINKAEIARNLGVDPRTVEKYIDGYEKPTKRDKKSKLYIYKGIIDDLLSSKTQVFYYVRTLYNYLTDNHQLEVPETTFRHFINSVEEYRAYFKKSKNTNNSLMPVMRFETPPGRQCQIDWKESIAFVLKDTGEVVIINVFVLMMSYSRFRIYRLSIQKTQEVLFNFLIESFEILGGVPEEVLTDNMKTVMDEARTEYYEGKVNVKFQEFAKDCGFKVKPCIAMTPETKAKVESPMKVLDEIRAYSGTLNYVELNELVNRLNNKYNTKVNDGTGKIPIMEFEKEKDFLSPLPNEYIRSQYKIKTNEAKVNSSSMISVKGNFYSVPPTYLGEKVFYQIIGSDIHIYHNKSLIALHKLSDSKMNIDIDHYQKIVAANMSYLNNDEVENIAKENLKNIGEIYGK